MRLDKLAELLGVHKDTLQGLREWLVEGMDWRKEGKSYEYTASALDKIRAKLAPAQALGAQQADLVVAPGQELQKLQEGRIVRLCPNPTWIVCRTREGKRVEVRVRNNRQLRIGQPIKWVG